MTGTVRLTAAQALVRYLAAQRTIVDGREEPLFAGCFAIFGHGNVAGMGEALYGARETLPTYRAHNEQGMALAAVAFEGEEPPADDGLHDLDRPRCHEHADGGRRGARQPAAGAA